MLIINKEKVRNHLPDFEYIYFLSKFHDEDVEVTIDLIENNPQIDWYMFLPELLDDNSFDEFNDYRGRKLIELNGKLLQMWFDFKKNHAEYTIFDLENFEKERKELNKNFEKEILTECLKYYNKEEQHDDEKQNL